MSFPRYPKYKPSGVEWLGDVPAHWEMMRLRQLGRLLKGSGGSKEDLAEAGTPCIRYGDLYTTFSFHITKARGFVTADREPDYTPIETGDVLFAASGEKLAEIGKSAVNLLTTPAVCGGDVVILRPEVEVDSRFLGYACDAPTAAMQKASMGRGTTVKHIYPDELRLLLLALPPLPEQRAIAAFLDRETVKIDGLVDEQRRLVELLKEKRQAVISHAVTKGLDPKAPMKPSGVEWLGDVPAHWAVMRLEHVAEFVWGKAHEPFVDDAGHHVCVTARFISTNGEAARYCTQSLAPARRGDILMVMSDLPNGRALARAFLVADGRSYAINQRVCAVRLLQGDPAYFAMQLDRNRRLLAEDDGANQTHLSNHDFTKLTVLVPPPAEQTAIGASVGDLRARFDALSTEAEAAITLLQERRSALISAAVTGQIDVRNATTTEAA